MEYIRLKDCEEEGHETYEKNIIFSGFEAYLYEQVKNQGKQEGQELTQEKNPDKMFFPQPQFNQGFFQQQPQVRHLPKKAKRKSIVKQKQGTFQQLSYRMKLGCLKCFVEFKELMKKDQQALGNIENPFSPFFLYNSSSGFSYFSHLNQNTQRRFVQDLLQDQFKKNFESNNKNLQKKYELLTKKPQKFKHQINSICNDKYKKFYLYLRNIKKRMIECIKLRDDQKQTIVNLKQKIFENQFVTEVQNAYCNFEKNRNKNNFETSVCLAIQKFHQARNDLVITLEQTPKFYDSKVMMQIQGTIKLLIQSFALKYFMGFQPLLYMIPARYKQGVAQIQPNTQFIFKSKRMEYLPCIISKQPLEITPKIVHKYYYELSLLDWEDIEQLDSAIIYFCLIGPEGYEQCLTQNAPCKNMPAQTAKWKAEEIMITEMKKKFLQKEPIEIMIELKEKEEMYGGMHIVYQINKGQEVLIKQLNIRTFQQRYGCHQVYPLLSISGVNMLVNVKGYNSTYMFGFSNKKPQFLPFQNFGFEAQFQ